ncbi:uncharacterized protein LOC111691275 [Anoplophora glabripennis]|uniref:uncharacterized protein LOC111691275 n=1 Tax=Anoplophora glabripennis TaxID=217634 RepID=UPI00087554D8|nr:uncharacterized protein LOC111691275 [Anoplophora glabripennis]
MNKFVLILLLTAACVHAEEESSSSSESFLKSLANRFEEKLNPKILNKFIELSEKTKIQCPELEQTLDTTLEEVDNCIENTELGDNTLCSLLRNNLEKCLEPVKKTLVRCLPEESKGLPIMAIKIGKAVVDQACNSTVEEILELLNPCTRAKETLSYEACTKVRKIFREYKNKLPSKSLVCSLLPNIKSCDKFHQEASCKNPVTKSAMVNFFEAIDEATATECQDLNKTK